MAYFYVKNGGTATGDTGRSATQRTGLWNATLTEFYDNLEDAGDATTPPTDGDIICLSHLANSSWATTGTLTIGNAGTSGAAGLMITSVDNANQDQYLPGAIQTITATEDIAFALSGIMAGVFLTCGKRIISNGNCRNWRFIDSTLKTGVSTNDLLLQSDGAYWELINTDVDFTADNNGVSAGIYVENASTFIMRGGAILFAAATSWQYLSKGSGANGGFNLLFIGVDLSGVETALVQGLTVPFSNDTVTLKCIGCQMFAGVPIWLAAPQMIAWRVELFNSDDATASAYHRFYVGDGAGSAENNDATYVTTGPTWYEGSVHSSIEVVTTTLTSHIHPFRFELPAQYVDLSQAASNAITVDLVTDLTLTNTDIAAFLMYPDGTTVVVANWVTSGKTVGAGNFGVDPLAAGTTLPASALGAGDWTGEPVSPNFYKLVLDTSGDAGQAAAVSIRIEVYKPSIAAGKLFIHPLIALS